MAKRDLILHNFWWKATSLLLATIVWFVVARDLPTNTTSSVPRRLYEFPKHTLAVLRDSDDKRPIRITPTEVSVTVSAPVTEAARLTDADIQTFIDLNEAEGRVAKVRIRVYVPRGVRLEEITPDEATVEVIE